MSDISTAAVILATLITVYAIAMYVTDLCTRRGDQIIGVGHDEGVWRRGVYFIGGPPVPGRRAHDRVGGRARFEALGGGSRALTMLPIARTVERQV